MKLRPIPDYADLFTFTDFTDLVHSGTVINYDGTGYYCNSPTEMTDIPVDCCSLNADFSHVAWFNK